MKSKNSIKKTICIGILSASAFLVDSNSVFAQNNLQVASKNANTEYSKSTLQNSAFSSFSTNEKKEGESPWEKQIGITAAFGENATSATLGFSHLYGFGSSARFRLGYGVRLSSFFGSDRKFTAAPPNLASQDNPQYFKTGDDFLGANNKSDVNSQLNAVNLGIYTDYSITEKLLVGFNIDVVGFSFGAKKDGTVYDNASVAGMTIISSTSAKPTSFNLLLVGDNDIGTLNSEFWIGYKITSKIMVRGAFSYLFTEYTTEGKYQEDNDRFRYKAAQGAIGINYTF